jgi:undecaprenyl-diphosphatase
VDLGSLTFRSAALVGAAQILALWPGVSRSLVTLLAGLLLGMTVAAAVEFSFLLGLVTLSAASLYDVARNGGELFDRFGVVTPVVGLLTAWITAVLAVRWMVGAVSRHGLVPFGCYRIGAAGVATALMLTGAL